jgi:sulfoxide reductase heme-binding subunit YedZ
MHALLGSLALAALLLSAVASPLTHVTSKERRARLLKARRGLGLIGFGIAFIHATSSLLHVHATSFTSVWNRLHSLGYMQHGALALVVLFALTLTSFPRLNAKLGLRTWAALHRLAYVALLLAALHALEAPNMNPRVALAAFALSIAVVLARVGLALHRRLRPKRAEDAPTA